MKKKLLLLLCLIATAGASAKVIKVGTFPNGGTWQLTEFDNGERLLYIDAEVIPDYKQKEYSGYWWCSDLTTAPWRKYTCSGIDDFTLRLSSRVKTIGEYAFSQTQVRKVEFNPRTEPVTIKKGAFYNTDLKTFDFSYVKNIGEGAFDACFGLTSNEFPILEKCEADAFLDCKSLAKQRKIILGKQVSFSNLQGFADLGRMCYEGIEESVERMFSYGNYYIKCYVTEYVVHKGSKMTYVWPVEGYGTKPDTFGGYTVDNVTGDSDWTLNTTTGEFHLVRTILDAPKYDTPEARPWHALRDQIKEVELSRSPGKNYFYGCTNLEIVYTLDDMTHISYVGGNRYKYPIEERAFYGCSKLRAVFTLNKTYPTNPGDIGNEAFYGCSELYDIDLASCTRIGERAFSGCSKLRSLDFSGDLTYIDNGAFMNDTGLRTITLTGAAPGTGSSTNPFSGVTASQVTLHVPASKANTYEKAPWTSFKLDKSLEFDENGLIKGSIYNTLTWELTSNGILRLQGSSAIPDYNDITKQPWYNYRDFIRDIIIDDNIPAIGKNAFALPDGEESHVVTISIPRGCKSIGEGAFRNLNSLRNVYITRVETLGSYAFEGCTSLESIELGASLQEVGDYVFKNCHSLNDIENMNSTPATTTKNSFAGIKSGAYSLRGGPRKANDGQETVNLTVNNGDIVKYITDTNWGKFHIPYTDDRGEWVKAGRFGDGMWILYADGTMVISADNSDITDSDEKVGFWTSWDNPNDPCKLTKKIEFTGKMEVVPACFGTFENLETVELCPSIKTIYRYAFENCSKLKNINFEEVDTIKEGAFQSAAFETLNLSNVKEIEKYAFRKCLNLTEAQLGPVCKLGLGAFSGCSKLTTIDLSAANIEDASGCFSGCSSLKSVTTNATCLPGGIFRNCTTLETVKLGSKLESIVYDAFENCTGLRNIYIDRPTPPALPKGEVLVPIGEVDYVWEDAWAFDGLTLSSINLTVPEEYVSAYRAANIWKSMTINGEVGNIDAGLPTGGTLGKNGTWYLDENGILTIDASGDIEPFDSYGKPWCETFNAYVGLIKSVVVSDGVISIPDNFFGGEYFSDASAGVETVKLGRFLKSVGANSLSFSGIKNVYVYSEALLELEANTFNLNAAVSNGATLHVLKASDNRYRSYYVSNSATSRFPNIVADINGQEAVASGTLGTKGFWTFADGVLTVTYNGAMPTIDKSVTDPEKAFRYKWIDFLSEITEIDVIGTDVEVQPYFLYYEGDGPSGSHPDDHIKTVKLGEGVKSIGRGSFSLYELKNFYCYSEQAPTLPATIASSYKAFWASRITANQTFLHVPKGAKSNYALTNTEWVNFANMIDDLYQELAPSQDILLDFEEGNMGQVFFINDSQYPWDVTSEDAASGSYSMKSGNKGVASSSSAITAYFLYGTDGYIVFDAKFMGEGTGTAWDKCIFYIDGVEQFTYGARGDGWFKNNAFPVSAGMHTFKWEYTKDSTTNPEGDAFFVDNIYFLQEGKDDDRITGVESLTSAFSEGEGTWFDLSGRKLGGKPMQAGIYIQNGRKVVIK